MKRVRNGCDDICFVLFFDSSFCFQGGWTALHSAASSGWEDIVKTLLEHG